VWATGVLSAPEAVRAGAYRSSASRRRLQAPRRGRVEITVESPLPRWEKLAAAYRGSALVAVVLGGLLHVVVYRPVDVAVVRHDPIACSAILEDTRYLPVLLGSGLLALAVAGVDWQNRVRRARGRGARSR
jgi:hypothetical protein